MDPSTATIDPATGQPLPPDAIVRVLHVSHPVHVYAIPPGTVSTSRGYAAASWTADPRSHIFTARLRVLETSFTLPPSPSLSPSSSSSPPPPPPPPTTTTTTTSDDDEKSRQEQKKEDENKDEEGTPTIKVDILLEDNDTGALFAAAPYTSAAAVEAATDSSRFFAVRVRDAGSGQKATLGIGFEERGEAFDFGVALQEAGRVLGWSSSSSSSAQRGKGQKGNSNSGSGGKGQGGLGEGEWWGDKEEENRDLSLKEGETITVNLSGTRFGRRVGRATAQGQGQQGEEGRQEQAGGEGGEGRSLASFALPPPPPPPASGTREARAQKRLSAQELGFDDGQFGEFA